MMRAIWISLAVLGSVIYVRSQSTPLSNSDIPRGRAALLSLSKPVYPQMARVANVFGEVKVSVTVHPDDTTDVVGLSGHPLLRSAAIDSAKQSHFACRACTLPLVYLLTYDFEQSTAGDCCTGTSMPVQVQQWPEQHDDSGNPETRITATAEHFCFCDPGAEIPSQRRSLKCLYLWKCAVSRDRHLRM